MSEPRSRKVPLAWIVGLVALSLPAFGKTQCVDSGKLRFSKDGREESWSRPYCLDPARGYFVNAECHRAPQSCEALRERVLPASTAKLGGEIGTRSHLLCKIVGGSPMLMSYRLGSAWIDGSLCLFKDDSFVGLDYLESRLVDFGN